MKLIEPIELKNLPSVPLSDRADLPTSSGIYFAFGNGKLQYIGRSINIRQRWVQHHRYHQLVEMKNASISWLEVEDAGALSEMEIDFIKQFDPPLNDSRAVVRQKRDRVAPPSGKRKTRCRWSLDAVMTRIGIKNTDLADRLGKHQNSVSRMRRKMPRMDGDELAALLNALNDIYEERGLEVQIGIPDLLPYK